MLQSPYFFFDVVYLHNDVEEPGDETSWRVSEPAKGYLRLDFIWIVCMFCLCHSLMQALLLLLLHKTHILLVIFKTKKKYI